MKSEIPQFETINNYNFYNLNEYGWVFENDKKGIENNKSIIKKISQDFSERSGISVETVIKAFDIDYIYTRSTEHLMLLYSNKGSNEVHYYFINKNSVTFKKLAR